MSAALDPTHLDSGHAATVEPELLACCASPAWARELLSRGPFEDIESVLAGSDAAFSVIADADIDQALSGHPRIGGKVAGAGADADFSRKEQASMSEADADVAEALRFGNVAYEQRFDRVFLIRAAGRTPTDMLTELNRRLRLDDEAERAEVREQLRQITRLRLEQFMRE